MTQDEIQKVIDDDINPGLAMHGGFISIHDFLDRLDLVALIINIIARIIRFYAPSG